MSSENFVCQFCNTEFEKLNLLNSHKKRSPSCLEIQGKIKKIYKCEFCDKEYTSEKCLKNHHASKKCNMLYKNELDRLKETIKKLENLISTKDKELEYIISTKDKEIERLNMKVDVLIELTKK